MHGGPDLGTPQDQLSKLLIFRPAGPPRTLGLIIGNILTERQGGKNARDGQTGSSAGDGAFDGTAREPDVSSGRRNDFRLRRRRCVTFDDLAGNSIACNGVTFSNFANFSSFGDFGANAPDGTEVVVVALISATGQTQLVFSSDDWIVLAGQTMNTSLTYSVLGARPIDRS